MSGRLIAPRTTVPKTPIHEDSNSFVLPDEVGAAGKVKVPPPTREAVGPQEARQPQLRGLVATSPNGGHDPGPGLGNWYRSAFFGYAGFWHPI